MCVLLNSTNAQNIMAVIKTKLCSAELHDFMDGYKTHPGLSVHWIWVGPDGHVSRPATGGVLPYYTMCSAEADHHIKTIANTYFLDGVDIHPHNFHFMYATDLQCDMQCNASVSWYTCTTGLLGAEEERHP
jgi:hypothetical protein